MLIASLCFHVYVCTLHAELESLVNVKIEIEHSLHCIDKYDDHCFTLNKQTFLLLGHFILDEDVKLYAIVVNFIYTLKNKLDAMYSF